VFSAFPAHAYYKEDFMAEKLFWGILGTGRIAQTFAKNLRRSRTGHLVAIGSRTQEAAKKFGEAFEVAKTWGDELTVVLGFY
jgi:predicted dehydrogenase